MIPPMFVLAHLSDPHLAPLPRPNPFELMGKRLSGFVNWHRKRRRFHLTAVLEQIVDDVNSRSADHVAVTGDLVNLSLAAEFPPARSWLERLGPPQNVTLVPGNHDTYVRSKARHPEYHWADCSTVTSMSIRCDGSTRRGVRFPRSAYRRRPPLSAASTIRQPTTSISSAGARAHGNARWCPAGFHARASSSSNGAS